jgi:hypothetical protein
LSFSIEEPLGSGIIVSKSIDYPYNLVNPQNREFEFSGNPVNFTNNTICANTEICVILDDV